MRQFFAQPRSRLLWWQVALFAVPFGFRTTLGYISNPWIHLFLIQEAGVSLEVMSATLAFQTGLVVLVLPIVGNYFDSFQSRHGRRFPVLVGSSIVVLVAFSAILLYPETLSSTGRAYWASGFLAIYTVAWRVWRSSFNALSVEFTDDADERVKLYMAQGAAVFAGELVGSALPGLLFSHTALIAQSLVAAFAFFLSSIAGAWYFADGGREEFNTLQQEEKPFAFTRNLSQALRNSQFMLVLVATLLQDSVYELQRPVLVQTYVFGATHKQLAQIAAVNKSISFCCVGLWQRAASKWKTKRVLQVGLVTSAAVTFLILFAPVRHLTWEFWVFVVSVPALMNPVSLLFFPLVTAAIDLDHYLWRPQNRREGLYTSLYQDLVPLDGFVGSIHFAVLSHVGLKQTSALHHDNLAIAQRPEAILAAIILYLCSAGMQMCAALVLWGVGPGRSVATSPDQSRATPLLDAQTRDKSDETHHGDDLETHSNQDRAVLGIVGLWELGVLLARGSSWFRICFISELVVGVVVLVGAVVAAALLGLNFSAFSVLIVVAVFAFMTVGMQIVRLVNMSHVLNLDRESIRKYIDTVARRFNTGSKTYAEQYRTKD